MTVMMGTVLFRTEVSPLEISFSANANKAAGSRALNRPRTKNANQTRPMRGISCPWTLMNAYKATAPMSMRADANASGGMDLLAIWMSRNDAPQRTLRIAR